MRAGTRMFALNRGTLSLSGNGGFQTGRFRAENASVITMSNAGRILVVSTMDLIDSTVDLIDSSTLELMPYDHANNTFARLTRTKVSILKVSILSFMYFSFCTV